LCVQWQNIRQVIKEILLVNKLDSMIWYAKDSIMINWWKFYEDYFCLFFHHDFLFNVKVTTLDIYGPVYEPFYTQEILQCCTCCILDVCSTRYSCLYSHSIHI